MAAVKDEIIIAYDMNDLRENGPAWKAGDYIIIEHLTMEDMQRLGETPESDGVVRMSLADDQTGINSRKLIDVSVDFESHDFITRALLKLSDLAEGFKLATALRGEEVGMLIRPPKMPFEIA